MSFAGRLKRKYSNVLFELSVVNTYITTLPAETGPLESTSEPLPYGLKILADGVDPVLE
ncbi:hypothetical protein MMC31_007140 [Peltigera leucophlebia]|nr:hypothetical protein [Peltigera leucophlebia]